MTQAPTSEERRRVRQYLVVVLVPQLLMLGCLVILILSFANVLPPSVTPFAFFGILIAIIGQLATVRLARRLLPSARFTQRPPTSRLRMVSIAHGVGGAILVIAALLVPDRTTAMVLGLMGAVSIGLGVYFWFRARREG